MAKTGLRKWFPGIPRSMRWQLPSTYAAIALLTCVALGIILLSTLRYYYAQVEFDYLMGNAKFISATVADQLSSGAPIETIESQVEGFAFLAQARVKLFDSKGQVIADSGAPTATTLQIGRRAAGQMLVVIRGAGDANGIYTSGLRGAPGPPGGGAVPITRSLFGFDLGATGAPAGTSLTRARLDVPNTSGSTPLGSVELSDGPAYGTEIVAGVAKRWGAASALAVLLAAAIGWVVSRRITKPLLALTALTGGMAAGDLAVRADATGSAFSVA
jgi:methyl-accepting chemotaxis protein